MLPKLVSKFSRKRPRVLIDSDAQGLSAGGVANCYGNSGGAVIIRVLPPGDEWTGFEPAFAPKVSLNGACCNRWKMFPQEGPVEVWRTCRHSGSEVKLNLQPHVLKANLPPRMRQRNTTGKVSHEVPPWIMGELPFFDLSAHDGGGG